MFLVHHLVFPTAHKILIEGHNGSDVPLGRPGRFKHPCPQSCLTLWDPIDLAHQAPFYMGFYWQEYWNGLPFPSPRDLLHPRIEPTSLTSPALAGGFFTISGNWDNPQTPYLTVNRGCLWASYLTSLNCWLVNNKMGLITLLLHSSTFTFIHDHWKNHSLD